MKPLRQAILVIAIAAGAAQAQPPAQPAAQPQMTPQQMQEAMQRQMQMMAALFDVKDSKLGFEETVTTLRAAAEKRGWAVEKVEDVQAAMKAQGAKDAPRMKVIFACPKDANDQLNRASGGKLPPLPCRLTVFETKEGKTQVMRMNTGNLARAVQGEAAKVLAQVASEEEAVLKAIQ